MTNAAVSITNDFDYLKIKDDGQILITTTTPSDADFQFPNDPFGGFGSGEQGVVPIFHGLGTVPLVRAFIDPLANGTWYSSQFVNGFITIDPDLLTLVDTVNLKLCVNSFGGHVSNIPVFYRIYYPGTTAVDSDSRIDKVFMKSPSGGTPLSVGSAPDSFDAVQASTSVPHLQNEQILWTMQFSDDGGATWYNDGAFHYGGPDTNSGPPGGPYSSYYYTRAYASGDVTNFNLRAEHNYPSTVNFIFRWALDYRT